jgi:4,5:9,10-diseco-3-hydroxy-5,9,17-trioxoandrosta-1(10),2-diene-4-oate hydrolase
MSEERPATPPFGRLLSLPDGYDMHYLEHGTGPAVVFVHGSGPGVSSYSNFFPNYKVIAAAGYRALLPDMLGFGWSSKPTGIDYTLELFTSTLGAFLDKLDVRRCVLVGNSLGGAISLGYTLKHPERVSKLVLMGPGGIETRETYFKMPGIQRMVSEFVGAGFDRAGLKKIMEILAYDPKFVTDELVEMRFNVFKCWRA